MPYPESETLVYWDDNTELGKVAYCNGIRLYNTKKFLPNIPPFLIINVEAIRAKAHNIIPDVINVGEGNYYFVGVTLHRYGKSMANHYTLLFKRRNGERLYYEGSNVMELSVR